MNRISLKTNTPTNHKIKDTGSLKKPTNIQNIDSKSPLSNKESLKIASSKASTTNKTPTLENKVKDVLDAGVNYFIQVSNKAREDRAKGVGTLEGANNLWKQLSSEADKIGQKAQNEVIDKFVKDSTGVIADSLIGTQSATATTTSTTTTAAGTTATTANVASTIVGGVGAAYSLYQMYDTFGKSSPVEGAMNGATVGAYVGSCICPGIGTVIGGVVGGIAGAALGLINNRKHPETIQRDQMRDALTQFGFIDKDHNIKLADGTSYSLGTDSKHTLANTDGTKRFGYQIDFSNPLAGKAIALTQPLAEALTGGHDKLKTDLLGYLTNAATSNASSEEEVKANVLTFYKQSGLSQEALATSLGKLTEENKITKEEIQVYANDLSSLFNGSENEDTQDVKKAA